MDGIKPIAKNLQTPFQNKLVQWWQGVSVRVKFTTLAIAMSTIPVLAIGRTAYYFANQSITQQVEAFGKARVVDLQQKANLFMRQRFADIQTMASLDVFTDPKLWSGTTAQVMVPVLTRLMNSYGIYDSIAIFDLQGNVVAQTPGPLLGNQINQHYIQAALKNNGPSISQPMLSESSKVFCLYAASIIKDKATDRPIGFIRARVPMEFLDEVLRNYATQGTQYYLINADNEVFLGPQGSTEGTRVITFNPSNTSTTKRREEYKKIVTEEIYPFFERLKAVNEVSTAISYNSITKTEQLLSYSPPVQLRGLPNLDWRAIVSVDTDTAFATQRQYLLTLSIGTAIAALLVAAIAVVIANRATRPILQAATAVEKIGLGALGTRLHFQGKDEIASLGSNINQMARQLQESLKAQAFEAAQERLLTTAQGSGALRTPDLQDIFDLTLEGTQNLLQLDRLVIYRFNAGSSGGVVSESVAAGWSSAVELNVNDSCIPQVVRDAYHQGRVMVEDDISQAGFHLEHLKLLEQLQVKASLIVPILAGGEIFGLLIAHSCSGKRHWHKSEINFLKRLGNELGLSINRVELLERTISLAEEQRQLKERLQKRAIELLIEVDPISQGDLMVRAKVTDDEIGTIADVYNATVASLRKIVLQVQKATNQVVVTTNTNDLSVQSLSAEALRQAEEVTAALDLVTAMANTAREVAANAAQAEEAVKLADRALQALEAHPDRALEITQLALADFERSRTAVLSGDRVQPPGATSFALIALAEATTTTLSTSRQDTAAESITPAVPSDLGSALQVSQSTELYQTIPPFYVHQDELPTRPSLTVRVDSERLESMNNLVGELVISREGLFLQNEQILGALRNLRQRFAWLGRQMNDLQQCDQTPIAPEHDDLKGKPSSNFPNGEVPQQSHLSKIGERAAASGDHFTTPEFDSLEIDRYGALHSHVQVILEEMVQLEEITDDMDLFAKQSEHILAQQRHMLTQLGDDLLRARMLPLGEVLNSFPRVLRDLSTTYNKPVTLKLTGTDVLVEKEILEKLYDPLLHLLRNAFDHGIELPEIRRQHFKPEQGQIEICAYYKGNQTIIEVKDDGQGLNLERIRSRALELGWLSIKELANTPSTQLYELIFEPGFSTASQVNQLSGRGIGLDMVRSQLQSIKGTITVKSLPRQGTSFTIYLPLTLTIVRLMICSSGSTTIALRTDSVIEILTPESLQIRQSGTQRFLYWSEKIIPLYQLTDLLDYTCPLPETPPSRIWASTSAPESWKLPVLIIRQDQQMVALQVARLLTEQELVVKPFGAAIAPPSYTYGCTILGDGSLIPVIDADALLSFAQTQNRGAVNDTSGSQAAAQTKSASVRPSLTASKPVQTPMVLVVDDAVTLRQTLVLSLKRSGFRVLQAQNGQEAIELLRQNSSVQLVICDIEMPRMNGFEFLSYHRQNPQFSHIPVVMLTSRSNEKYYRLAMQLGATAYFAKPYLEQELVMTVNNIFADAALKSRTC